MKRPEPDPPTVAAEQTEAAKEAEAEVESRDVEIE